MDRACALVWLVSALAFAAPATAQTKLHVLFQGTPPNACGPARECQPGSVMVLDLDTQQIESSTFVLHARTAQDVRVTSDGRYVLWIGAEDHFFTPRWLTVFDIVSRAFSPLIRVPNLSPLFAHPSRVQLYYQAGRDIVAVDPTVTRVNPMGCEFPALESLSHDGSRLFVRCGALRHLVYDTASGAQVADISVRNSNFGSAPTADGRALFVTSQGSATAPRFFSKYDVQTGTLLAERSEAGTGFTWQTVDPRSGDLYVQLQSFPPRDRSLCSTAPRWPCGPASAPRLLTATWSWYSTPMRLAPLS